MSKVRPVPRSLILPPAGRPRWVCPPDAALDLLYLSWGRRRFGASPIPVSLHPGWIYAYVVRGNPALQLEGRVVRLHPGELVIVHPDCASGWADAPRGSCELLTWLWRTDPRCEPLAVASGAHSRLVLPAPLARGLAALHRACRQEVERPDPWTKPAIERLRLQLDVMLARCQGPRLVPPQPAVRLELALRWLAQNPTEKHPVTELCRYLQVSPITLNRLFRSELGESVARWHQRAKLQHALALLEQGAGSVKEVGFRLGYRHPNDFSRAIYKAFGRRPGTLLRRVHASGSVGRKTGAATRLRP